MYTRGGKSTVEKPTLVNKPKIYKGRLGEVREARGGKSTKPKSVLFSRLYGTYFFMFLRDIKVSQIIKHFLM